MFMGDARCRCREELSQHRRECTDSMPTRYLIAALARLRKQEGFEFCIRYVSRQDVQPVGDLSEAEANVILGAGLALMAVQHVAPENWSPSQALGTRNGKNAAKHARQIGFPDGVNVWLDLEGARTSTPHETMIACCNAWFAEVEGCGIRS